MRKAACLLLLVLSFACHTFANSPKSITVEDLFQIGRLSDLQLSPDGKWLSYVITFYDMTSNKSNSDIWLLSTAGGEAKQLTTSPQADYGARWSPCGKFIAFISSRNGTPQIFVISPDGGEAKQLSDISTGADGIVWSPDGKYIAFTSEVYPDLHTDIENQARDIEKEQSLVKAKIIDRLFFRYWNHWTNEKRSHVLVMKSSGGKAWDVTPGDFDSPPLDLGSNQDYSFSPDSKEIAFVRNQDPVVAISTNNDIFITSVEGGGQIEKISDNKANDNGPVFSSDGRYLAYRAMNQPGFEADQYDILLLDRKTKTTRNLTAAFDRSVENFSFSKNEKEIFFTAQNQARSCLYSIPINGGTARQLTDSHYITDFCLAPDNKNVYFLQQAINRPTEIFRADAEGKSIIQLTFTNKQLVDQIVMNDLEDFWFSSFDGKKIHGLLVKPPQFVQGKKYPLVYLIHGGPQGMWSDEFHYRWNAQMFAAPGYVVAMVNFRGSTGYGQDFCNAVSKDWGSGPYRDLMTGVDHFLKTYDFIDHQKLAAAGASYGGFMIDWICGQPNPFKVLVSHDGVYDLRSMYGATEELWFPEWEFNGTPYHKPDLYEKWSPSNFAKYFRTPTLVVHSENDFRVPVSQGFQMFTALQRNGVPSKLLYFPDEDHFVRKPQNARLWWNTVLNWIDEWLNK